MRIKADQIPFEKKWAMATKGLTSALAAHMDALYRIAGKKEYSKTIHEIWSKIGTSTAQEIKSSGISTDDAASVAMAGVTSCICAMGPEYEIEQISSDQNNTVIKITGCPWQNRMKEQGISHDLLSACDIAFWNHFAPTLNPNVTMKHGKQMHRGDPYCEWIFENTGELG